MRVTASSEPGSPDTPNEDAYFISPNGDTVAIFDGATTRTGTGCTHGVAWYTHSLAGALAFEHLRALKPHQSGMGKIEGHGKTQHAIGCEELF